MIRIAACWIALFGAATMACTNETSLYPLNVGAIWKYDATWNIPGQKPGQGVSTERITERVLLEDQEYFKSVWKTEGLPGATALETLYRNTSRGTVGRPLEDPRSSEHLVLPARPSIGDEWSEERFGGSITYEIVSLTSHVETPAGDFICIEIEMHGTVSIGDAQGTIFFAPGVGTVKQIEAFSNGLRFEYVLFEYDLSPDLSACRPRPSFFIGAVLSDSPVGTFTALSVVPPPPYLGEVLRV